MSDQSGEPKCHCTMDVSEYCPFHGHIQFATRPAASDGVMDARKTVCVTRQLDAETRFAQDMPHRDDERASLRPSEKELAIKMANRALDVPYADPDDDLRTISRQFLRAIEPRNPSSEAGLRELVEECGLALASEEIRCNFKHVKTFDLLNKLRAALAKEARDAAPRHDFDKDFEEGERINRPIREQQKARKSAASAAARDAAKERGALHDIPNEDKCMDRFSADGQTLICQKPIGHGIWHGSGDHEWTTSRFLRYAGGFLTRREHKP